MSSNTNSERLNKLKNLLNRKNQADNEDFKDEEDTNKPILKFRNYEPTNPELIALSNLSQPEAENQNEVQDNSSLNENENKNENENENARRDDEGFEIPQSKHRKLDTNGNEVTTVEQLVENIEQPIIESHQSKLQSELDIAALAPTQLEWDLKADLDKRMKKLNKQTQKKIVELIKLRLNPPTESN